MPQMGWPGGASVLPSSSQLPWLSPSGRRCHQLPYLPELLGKQHYTEAGAHSPQDGGWHQGKATCHHQTHAGEAADICPTRKGRVKRMPYRLHVWPEVGEGRSGINSLCFSCGGFSVLHTQGSLRQYRGTGEHCGLP